MATATDPIDAVTVPFPFEPKQRAAATESALRAATIAFALPVACTGTLRRLRMAYRRSRISLG